MTFRHVMAGAAAASALLGAGTGVAQAAPQGPTRISDSLAHRYLGEYHKVKKLGGQPGRNLMDDGVRKHGVARAARAGELRRSLRVLDRMAVELTAPAPAPATTSASSTATTSSTSTTTSTGAPSGTLAAIAACESGGNASAVDSSGTYGGKYQFDQQTWNSVGGTGSPASAPAAVQDQMAARLYAQRGASAWPTCGR